MSKPNDLALKIMALVDELPSEPFSFERKQVENRITDMIFEFTQQTEDELDVAYQNGFDEGYDEGRREAEEELDTSIQDLEEKVNDLQNELAETKSQLDQSFAEGYETASRESGHAAETLNFK